MGEHPEVTAAVKFAVCAKDTAKQKKLKISRVAFRVKILWFIGF